MTIRVILKFKPLTHHAYNTISNYDIQGFIYNLLRGTYFHNHHLHQGFKFFTFSNIFPITPYNPNKPKTLIIASPNDIYYTSHYDKYGPVYGWDKVRFTSHFNENDVYTGGNYFFDKIMYNNEVNEQPKRR